MSAPTATEPAIDCAAVSKAFRPGERADSLRDLIPRLWRPRRDAAAPFRAVQDVSFTVPRGTAFGVIGPNGAGKSTLLRLLTRILVPDSGRIAVRGRVTALLEVGSGFHPELTGLENIFLSGALLGLPRRAIRAQVAEIVAFAEVDEFLDTPLKRYSSGMQARLGFAIAAHLDPDILLVDEVLAVGDAAFQARCLARMRHFAESGRTIVFISHDLRSVARLCSRTLVLLDGRPAYCGPTAGAIQAYLEAVRSRSPRSTGMALDRVEIQDEQGQPRWSFRPGAAARVAFTVTLDRPADTTLLALQITRMGDGMVIAEYNLAVPDTVQSHGTEALAIDLSLNCCPGSYAVTIVLLCKATYARLAQRDCAGTFEIEGTRQGQHPLTLTPVRLLTTTP